MDDALRRKICRLVAGIVVTDDDFDPTEDAFIDRMLSGFGLPTENRDLILPLVDANEAAAEMERLPPEAKVEALALLFEAATADGKVVEEERDYLRTVGAVLGLDHPEIDRRIAERLAAHKPR